MNFVGLIWIKSDFLQEFDIVDQYIFSEFHSTQFLVIDKYLPVSQERLELTLNRLRLTG